MALRPGVPRVVAVKVGAARVVGRRTRRARPDDRPGAVEATIRQENKTNKGSGQLSGAFWLPNGAETRFHPKPACAELDSVSKDRTRDPIRYSVVSLIESLRTAGMIACAIRS